MLFYYILLSITLLYAWFVWRMRRALTTLHIPAPAASVPLRVSVVIAVRNEEKNLPGLFQSLENQHIPDGCSVEFILVNDRSEDNTAALIRTQCTKDPRFKTINITDRVPGFAPKKRAIDRAVRGSKADIILLTDADGRPGVLWINTLLSYFSRGADMVIGYAPYSGQNRHRFLYGLVTLEYFSVAAVAAATTALHFPVTCVGTNMAYRRSLFLEVNGFGPYKHVISGDDDLFLTHVREQKRYRIEYAASPKAHVYNAPPRSVTQYVNQRLRYASKGFRYPIKVIAALSAYVLYNAALPAAALESVYDERAALWTALIFIIKAGAEFLFLHKAAHIMDERRTLKFFPAAFPLHPLYILFFGILGQFNMFRWKENTLETGVSR